MVTEPLSLTGAKLIAPKVIEGTIGAVRKLWKYYNDPDLLHLPSVGQASELSDFVVAQLRVSPIEQSCDVDQCCRYLVSAEGACFLRSCIAFHLYGRPARTSDALHRLFETGVRMYGEMEESEESALFRCLTAVAGMLVNRARSRAGNALDEGAMRSSQADLVQVYLHSIDSQLAEINSNEPVTRDEVDQFLRSYAVILRGLARIQPPSLDGAETIPIDDLYVTPEIVVGHEEGGERRIGLDSLIEMHRVVLLGDPGGGKSTASLKVLDLLSRGDGPAELNVGQVVPVLVILRDYGTYLSRSSGSILDFMVDSLRSRHQIDVRAEVLKWLLFSGRVYVLFDGLDELTQVNSRKQIASAVESFSSLHNQANVLVTSRRVGYQQAPLSKDEFVTASLGEFSPSDVERYVEKWFNLDKKLTPSQKERAVAQFISESATVDDLRRNPLMLALMCNIYRTESYIPRNRPDVYSKCARMLFDQWDRHRGLFEAFDFEAHIEPAIMHLADVMYSDRSLQSGASEASLVRHAAEYLNRWQYENFASAEHAASKFIRFCRGRAWVLTDVGLSSDGESLYQFTHRTFLEYFKAAHLDRLTATLEELLDQLMSDIQLGQSDVVTQLALHMKSKTRQGGPDIVVSRLLAACDQANSESRAEAQNVVSFAVRSLAFLVPSPPVTQLIAVAIFRSALTDFMTRREDGTLSESWPMSSTNQIAREIKVTFKKAIIVEILRLFDEFDSSGMEVEYACSVLVHGDLSTDDHDEELTGLYGRAEEIAFSLMRQNQAAWAWPNVVLYSRDKSSMEEVIQCLDLRVVADGLEIPSLHGSYVALGESLLSRVSWPVEEVKRFFDQDLEMLRKVADHLESEAPAPASRFGNNLMFTSDQVPLRRFSGSAPLIDLPRSFTSEERRACGIVMASIVELWCLRVDAETVLERGDQEFSLGGLQDLAPLLTARILRQRLPEVDNESPVSGLLKEWARHEKSFVSAEEVSD